MKNLFDLYGIDPACGVDAISTGLINKTWKLRTAEEAFILQRVNQHVFRNPPAIAENIRMLGDYLRAHHPDYMFVAPLASLDGRTLVTGEDGGFYRLFPFVQDARTVDTVSCPTEAFEAAVQFGRFTGNLSDFDSTRLHVTIPDFHNLSLRFRQFEEAVRKDTAGRVRRCPDEIANIRRNRKILDDFKRLILDAPVQKRVIHHDAKINNVLFGRNNRSICLIDLDTVMAGYFISDVGDMIRTYVSPVGEEEPDLKKIGIRLDVFEAIAQGYLQEMRARLNSMETRLILYAGYFMVYMQAVRFLTDFLQGDTYYAIRHESHNLDRARNQLELLKRLQEQEEALEEIIKKEAG